MPGPTPACSRASECQQRSRHSAPPIKQAQFQHRSSVTNDFMSVLRFYRAAERGFSQEHLKQAAALYRDHEEPHIL